MLSILMTARRSSRSESTCNLLFQLLKRLELGAPGSVIEPKRALPSEQVLPDEGLRKRCSFVVVSEPHKGLKVDRLLYAAVSARSE